MNRNIKIIILFNFIFFVGFAQDQGSNFISYEKNEILNKINSLIINRPNFVYSKIQTQIASTSPEFSADIRLSTRVAKDSLIFANINYMGIQAASVHIDQNKGALIDRFNKCYIEGDAQIASNFLGVDLELLELEELILGLPIFYTKLDQQKVQTQVDSSGNLLVTFLGNIRTDSLEQKPVELKYTFDDSLTHLKQLNLVSPNDSLSLLWICKEYQDVSNYRLPYLVDIKITKLDSVIELNLKYNAVEINVPEIIEFEIPEGYEKCK